MKTVKDQNKEIEDILVKYLAGSASVDERDMARKWINESTEHQKYFDELKDYYQLTKVVQKPSGYDKEEGWKRIKEKYSTIHFQTEIDRKKKQYARKLIIIGISSAAAVFIAFFLGFNVHKISPVKYSDNPSIVYTEIVVPLGAKSQVTLSDGSKVWLNSGSKLRYPENFYNGSREVYLEGEAFFDVTKLQNKLFIVKTSNLNIKVYGTQFNVKAYLEENQIQTTLVQGSVALEPSVNSSSNYVYYLKPNQTATYFKNSQVIESSSKQQPVAQPDKNKPTDNILIVNKIDPIPIISWKDKNWIFVGEELGQLAVKLERRYNVKISFEDESLKTYKFSGTLTDLTFEQVLMVIQLSAPILFSIDGNNVNFKGNSLYRMKYDQMISKSKTN